MKIRDYDESDRIQLEKLHREQGWKYHFPDLDDSNFVVKRVLVDDDGVVVDAVFARRTVELYLLADHQWRTPKWRQQMIAAIHEDVRLKLKEHGYTDGHVWLPPEIAKSFGRRLNRMFNWVRNQWPCYSREV